MAEIHVLLSISLITKHIGLSRDSISTYFTGVTVETLRGSCSISLMMFEILLWKHDLTCPSKRLVWYHADVPYVFSLVVFDRTLDLRKRITV